MYFPYLLNITKYLIFCKIIVEYKKGVYDLNRLVFLPSRNYIKYVYFNHKDYTIHDLGIKKYSGDIKEGAGFIKEIYDEDTFDVSLIIPSNRAQVKSIETNKVEKKYLRNVIYNEFGDKLQLDENSQKWDYTISYEGENNYKILVSITNREYLENWISQLILNDIEPSVVSCEQLSLLNGFYFYNGYKPIIIVDIGTVDTNIMIYDREKEYFQMDIQIGYNDLLNNIQDIYDIPPDKANKILMEENLNNNMDENQFKNKPKFFRSISNLLDNIIYEIKRSIIFYENRYKEINFDEIMLSGGVANLSNIAFYIGYEVGAKVNKYNFYKNIKLDLPYKKKEILNNNILTFSNLFGGLL